MRAERNDAVIGAAIRTIDRLRRALVAVNGLLPAGLAAYGAATGIGYWRPFLGEDNTITWFSSVQLLVVGAVAYLNHVACGLEPQAVRRAGLRRFVWLGLAAGFLFLAIDERFELHEALRDRVLAPAGLFTGIPYVGAGDIGVYAYLAAGVAATLWLWPDLRSHRPAAAWYGAGVVVAAASTFVDGLPPALERQLPYFWTTMFEETTEIWTALLLLLSFTTVLRGRLVACAAREA